MPIMAKSNNTEWDIDAVHNIMMKVQGDYNIDANRIYLTGYSMVCAVICRKTRGNLQIAYFREHEQYGISWLLIPM